MALRATNVSQCLERRLRFLGYEIPDLLIILCTLSVLNFLLGQMPLKIFFVWGPTVALALVIRVYKHGKPDNHLLHTVRFFIQPKVLQAFPMSAQFQKPKFLGVRGEL